LSVVNGLLLYGAATKDPSPHHPLTAQSG
jgi:hypothetical protein